MREEDGVKGGRGEKGKERRTRGNRMVKMGEDRGRARKEMS